jgi:hypothetical protein
MARTFVAPVSFGLGDLVVSLPAVDAVVFQAAHSGDEPWLLSRAPSQALLAERIEGLAGSVDEATLTDLDRADRLIDLRDHPLQRDFWWGSPEFERAVGRLGINDILARICADFGLDADFSRPRPLQARPRPGLEESVVLVTEPDGTFKRWRAEHWASMASEVRAWGLEVRVVTRSGTTAALGGAGISAVCAPTPGDAVDVLTACRAVVGLDTGLTHIAAQQGTPTVTISRVNSVYFRPWPHTRVVTGVACDDACLAAEAAYAYNDRVSLRGFAPGPRDCPVDGACLAGIEPAVVAAALREVV